MHKDFMCRYLSKKQLFKNKNFKPLSRLRAADGHAFTLLEILIVISIVVLLAVAILPAFGNQNPKVRDSVREANINAIQNALVTYKLQNGRYPGLYQNLSKYIETSFGIYDTSTSTYVSPTGNWNTDGPLYKALVPVYISVLPKDPVNDGTNYFYKYLPSVSGSAECANIPTLQTGQACFYNIQAVKLEITGQPFIKKDY